LHKVKIIFQNDEKEKPDSVHTFIVFENTDDFVSSFTPPRLPSNSYLSVSRYRNVTRARFCQYAVVRQTHTRGASHVYGLRVQSAKLNVGCRPVLAQGAPHFGHLSATGHLSAMGHLSATGHHFGTGRILGMGHFGWGCLDASLLCGSIWHFDTTPPSLEWRLLDHDRTIESNSMPLKPLMLAQTLGATCVHENAFAMRSRHSNSFPSNPSCYSNMTPLQEYILVRIVHIPRESGPRS